MQMDWPSATFQELRVSPAIRPAHLSDNTWNKGNLHRRDCLKVRYALFELITISPG